MLTKKNRVSFVLAAALVFVAIAANGRPPEARRIRVIPAVQHALLKSKVPPHYPLLAKQARIDGVVKLRLTITTDGVVSNVEVLSGHVMLKQAAVDAVKKWRYKPTLEAGEPVEVTTELDISFVLP